jgi:carboxylesterase
MSAAREDLPGAGDVVPGAEPFSFEGGPAGVLLLHGFTGNPASLRQLGEWLAARGHGVECPRYPGHGSTSWRDLARHRWTDWARAAERGLDRLVASTEAVVVLGLSMGGAMALHLAARRPDDVRAVAVVNGYLRDRRILATPYVWPLIPPQKGIGNDIRKEGGDELPYERIPVRGVAELAKFLRVVRKEMPSVRQPLVVFNSPQDHVVPKGTAAWLMGRVGSEHKELIELSNSYHVATLDHDAELIFERTHELAESALREPSS